MKQRCKEIRTFSQTEMRDFFSVDVLQTALTNTSYDSISLLNETLAYTYDEIYLYNNGHTFALNNISYGFQVLQYIFDTYPNEIVTNKYFQSAMDIVEWNGLQFLENVPLVFLLSTHTNGQSKLICNAVELALHVPKSDDLRAVVIGSSSEGPVAGFSYLIMSYTMLLSGSSGVVDLYDPNEVPNSIILTHPVSHKTITINSHQAYFDYKKIPRYNVVLDDAWTLDGISPPYTPSSGVVYSIKSFVKTTRAVQPFYAGNTKHEVRIVSYSPSQPFRHKCFFGYVNCRECSYTSSLVQQIVERISTESGVSHDILETIRLSFLSWILGRNLTSFGNKTKSNLDFYHHSVMYRVLMSLVRTREMQIVDVNDRNYKDHIYFINYYRIVSSGRFLNDITPDSILYSLISYVARTNSLKIRTSVVVSKYDKVAIRCVVPANNYFYCYTGNTRVNTFKPCYTAILSSDDIDLQLNMVKGLSTRPSQYIIISDCDVDLADYFPQFYYKVEYMSSRYHFTTYPSDYFIYTYSILASDFSLSDISLESCSTLQEVHYNLSLRKINVSRNSVVSYIRDSGYHIMRNGCLTPNISNCQEAIVTIYNRMLANSSIALQPLQYYMDHYTVQRELLHIFNNVACSADHQYYTYRKGTKLLQFDPG